MEIRRLTQADRLPLNKLWSVCYLSEVNTEEAVKRLEETPFTDYGYGSFAENGDMASGVLGNAFTLRFEGQEAEMMGIGGVVTDPCYRNRGEVKRIMQTLLSDAYARGVPFSGLYPFKHAFYRKFGYEVGRTSHVYTFPLECLRGFSVAGSVRMLDKDDDRAFLLPVYRAFCEKYNLAIARTEKRMAWAMSSNPYAKNDYAYVIYEGGAPVAYVSYAKEVKNDRNVLRVRDFAFASHRAFQSLLGFLYPLNAEFKDIKIEVPQDIPMTALADSPYAVKVEQNSNFMIRVVNCETVLRMLRREGDYRFVIEVEDAFLPENQGKWLVTPGSAAKTDLPTDIQMSVQAFSQLAVGYVSLDGALFRRDVRLLSNEETLRRVFVKKPLYTGVYF